MGVPEPESQPRALDRVVDDQALAVLAAIDDLRHDLPGSVHDARVALRKLRSTLVVFRPLLDSEAASALDEGLHWFADELSGARDAQVVRSRVTTAIHGHPGDEAENQKLLTELDESVADAWMQAQASLSDPRLAELVVALERVRLSSLVEPGTDEELLPRLGNTLSGLVERAQRTAVKGDEEQLHRLRRRVRRVRFAVASMRDSAAGMLPAGSGAGRVAHALEELQELLGDYHDAVVTAGILDRIGAQVPRLADLAAELAESQRAAAATVRDALPGGVDRVRRATRRLAGRSPGVHLDPR